MKNKKLGLIFNIVVLCLCVCLITFGVYSAKTASLNVSGTVGFTAHNCNADIVIKTNGDSINASNERVSDGTTVRTTEAILKTAIGESTTYSDSAVQIRGKDVTLKLESFYFSDMTTDGSVNDITLTFEITNQSDFSIVAKVASITCAGVNFYASNGTTAFTSEDSESVIAKSAKTTITIVCKYTSGENLTTTNNLNISISLAKAVESTTTFKIGTSDYSFVTAKSSMTWSEWVTQDSPSGFAINANGEVCYEDSYLITEDNTIVKGTEKISTSLVYSIKVITIKFIVGDKTFSADVDNGKITWAEYIKKYPSSGFSEGEDSSVMYGNSAVQLDDSHVLVTNKIINNQTYNLSSKVPGKIV